LNLGRGGEISRKKNRFWVIIGYSGKEEGSTRKLEQRNLRREPESEVPFERKKSQECKKKGGGSFTEEKE